MRNIPDPGFAGDDGAVDPGVAKALASYAADPGATHDQTLVTLQGARLLVPVTAVAGEVDYDDRGLVHDKTSDMAALLMRGRDGRLALLAFTGSESMRAWNRATRPVPVTARQAAQAAVQDDATALVVDVAGPVMFVVEEDDLRQLAAGHSLVGLGERFVWVRSSSGAPGR